MVYGVVQQVYGLISSDAVSMVFYFFVCDGTDEHDHDDEYKSALHNISLIIVQMSQIYMYRQSFMFHSLIILWSTLGLIVLFLYLPFSRLCIL